ncbi:MAG: phosphotransferase [Gammaproteobacteria bacterium]
MKSMKYNIKLILVVILIFIAELAFSNKQDISEEHIAQLVRGFGYNVIKVQNPNDAGPSFINDIYEIIISENSKQKNLIIKLTNVNWGFKKLNNEVNILKFLRKNSNIPIPTVLAHSQRLNETVDGHYFILMEKVNGRPLSSFWQQLSPKQKIKLSSQLRKHVRELHHFNFNKIGSFTNLEKKQEPNEIIEIPKKSYPSAGSFYEYTNVLANYYLKLIASKQPEINNEVAKYTKIILETIKQDETDLKFQFVLCHLDLSLKNIMATENQITAILDWEWASAQPDFMEIFASYDWLPNLKEKMEFQNQKQIKKSHFNGVKLLHILYSLACYDEWFEGGKLKHTARFLDSKLLQRKVKAALPINSESQIKEIKINLKPNLIAELRKIAKN